MRKIFNNSIYTSLGFRLLIVYILFTICRIIFYIYNADMFASVSTDRLLTMCIGGLVFDTSAIIYLNCLFIILNIIPFYIRYNVIYQRIAKILFISFNSIGILANCIDIVYYKFTLKRTTLSAFNQFKNEDNMGSLFFRFIIDYWYITLLFAFLILILIWGYNKTRFSTEPITKKKSHFYSISTVIMFLILFLAWGGARGGFRHSTRPITLSNAGKYVENPNEMSIVLNTPFAILRTIGKTSLASVTYFKTQEEIERYYSPIHIATTPDSLMKKMNVVIFILESWSKEYIGYLNNEFDNGQFKGYTPFADSLMAHGLSFKWAFANGRKSIDALPAILAGIPYVKTPHVLSQYSGNTLNSLANYLKPEGYYTAFFHGAPNGSMGFNSFTKLAGFDDYFGKDEFNNDDFYDGMWGIWDEEFFKFYADKMSSFKEPFLTSVFSLSSHHPFEIPERYENKFEQGTIPLHRCIRYSDYALQQFFAYVKTMPWYENTLFIITADHASFPVRKEFKNDPGAFAVPLIFYTPDGSLQKFDTTTIAQQIDILPTVLAYLNYNKDYFAFGKNLLDTTAANYAFTYTNENFQCFSDKYVLQFSGDTMVSMFDFKRDMLQEYDLRDCYPQQQEDLENYTKAFIQEYTKRMISNDLTIYK